MHKFYINIIKVLYSKIQLINKTQLFKLNDSYLNEHNAEFSGRLYNLEFFIILIFLIKFKFSNLYIQIQ